MVVRQSGASEIDSESSFNRLYDEASTSSLSSRAEQALFNGAVAAHCPAHEQPALMRPARFPVPTAVLFVMTEQHRTSRLGSIVMLLLLLVDVVQARTTVRPSRFAQPAVRSVAAAPRRLLCSSQPRSWGGPRA